MKKEVIEFVEFTELEHTNTEIENNLFEDLNVVLDEVLTEQQKTVLLMSYGLNQHPVDNLVIADAIGVSGSYVGVIKKQALNILQENKELFL